MKIAYIFSFLLLWRLFGWESHRQNMGNSSSNIERNSAGTNGKCDVLVTRDLYILGICVDSESHWEQVDCQNAG